MNKCKHPQKHRHELGIRPVISWCENCGAFRLKDPWGRGKWKTPIKVLEYNKNIRSYTNE